MWFHRKYPTQFEAYRLRTPVNKKIPESSARWAILDFETTGFDVHKDRILSAAITIVENGQFHMKSFQSWYVYQNLKLALLLSGITYHLMPPCSTLLWSDIFQYL